MFDGSFTSKKRDNLGGSGKAKEEKKDFLARARREREQRAHERLRMKSAVVVQSMARSAASRHGACMRERAAWDSKLSDLGTAIAARQLPEHLTTPPPPFFVDTVTKMVAAAGQKFAVPLNIFKELLGQFLFFYRAPVDDSQRLHRMCAMFLENFTGYSALAVSPDAEVSKSWLMQVGCDCYRN